jgi:hypothetical protein
VRWHGPQMFETVGMNDGKVIGRGICEVSADGATLTVSPGKQGIVLDRETRST